MIKTDILNYSELAYLSLTAFQVKFGTAAPNILSLFTWISDWYFAGIKILA